MLRREEAGPVEDDPLKCQSFSEVSSLKTSGLNPKADLIIPPLVAFELCFFSFLYELYTYIHTQILLFTSIIILMTFGNKSDLFIILCVAETGDSDHSDHQLQVKLLLPQ